MEWLIGGGVVLVVLSMMGKKGGAAPNSQQPNANAQQPGTQPNPVQTIGTALGVSGSALSVIGTGVGIVTKIVAGVGVKAGSAAAETAAATAEASAEAVALSAADIGLDIMGGLELTAIIAVIVFSEVYDIINKYHDAVKLLLGYDIRAGSPSNLAFNYRIEVEQAANNVFRQALIGNPSVPQRYMTVAGVPGTYFTDKNGNALARSQVSLVMQVCYYLGIQQVQARNEAQHRFFTFLGDNNAQQRSTGEAFDDFDGDFVQKLLAGSPELRMTPGYFTQQRIANMPQSVLSVDGKPLSMGQLQAVAQQMLGANFAPVVVRMRAIGYAEAITLASISGFTFGWPGDEYFVRTIGQNTVPTWSVVQAYYTSTSGQRVTGADGSSMAWWLVDPNTGIRVAPIASRDATAFVISVPEATGATNGFAGRRGPFSGYAMIRPRGITGLGRYRGRR